MRKIVITGASSGLGAYISKAIYSSGTFKISNWSLETGVDVSSRWSVEVASSKIESLDILINCAGVNEIDYIEQTREADWDDVLDTNAKGIWLTAKYLVSKMRGGTILNIVSNASHVPMTGSIAYNASKAAAAIMTQQMHRELWKTHQITVFGISPNKLKGTGMSTYIEQRVCDMRGWSPAEAQAYQLAALPINEETDPVTLAEFITFLLITKERHKYLGGCIIPYGGP
jgi:NAD(P)-dependent dehydrogenase (short-subunit alcohol dehydrogenase family)